MSIKHEDIIVCKRSWCAVCNNENLIEIMSMPELPITGLFSKKKHADFSEGFDQALLWCPECGHGQLRNQINPEILYDSQKYTFRTSLSTTAQHGTEIFLDYLKTLIPNKKIECIIDVGCNDLYLLNKMKSFGKTRIGIDPIWTSKKPDNDDQNLHVIGGALEDIDLEKALPCKPDLIVCRHTLEHIFDPQTVLKKLIDCSTANTLFLFEMPGFESLITKGRFDQVFHEHLQYFSLSSLSVLLEKCGAELIGFTENYHNWGALIVAFRKKTSKQKRFKFPFAKEDIERKRNLFFSQMDNTRKILFEFKNTHIYGYGAALMLPVLAYHLKTDLSFLKAVIDDDKEKDDLFYANLPVQVQHSNKIENTNGLTIFVTAIDNIKPIMTKLFAFRPKHIIYPLHII
ncbi:MAG: hypothetical protein A3C43_01325 [Candidatus Schekmanbacteria bacterium RIFCSPHIGHO2_02_FULL_38_11]|nr:MAG: hypothetical protein A2043_09415 [Candidatus Schekmanbacteria bacterium GWA2_38_9]OGL50483.1 MAG: hypothetical protein A3H37_06380 [Candidatus Schekmanbacteria bacterium RIFCSPLOWO2_02_FULL_38_14]OGL54123.1 MAG: hypothetical protein A3C43_01325 [Candidatus Schekmanbacteria bacterium RIFCSPHIGHO2_02_FULL_38_11]